ncbi:hypothetical protein NPIL_91741 [Nephila pilipes]|uniref:Uncharacterized protein n=1 Tax=Nephila pilipes TaxID=299642 RepID=A0A8X6TQV4_NEPPI|nr:hypothetical protein NPIL_91741 [Nephila pilipes]
MNRACVPRFPKRLEHRKKEPLATATGPTFSIINGNNQRLNRFTLTIPGDKPLIPALRDYNGSLFQTTASVRWTFIQLVSQAQRRHDCDTTIVTPRLVVTENRLQWISNDSRKKNSGVSDSDRCGDELGNRCKVRPVR